MSCPGRRDRLGAMHPTGNGRPDIDFLCHCEKPERSEGDKAICTINFWNLLIYIPI